MEEMDLPGWLTEQLWDRRRPGDLEARSVSVGISRPVGAERDDSVVVLVTDFELDGSPRRVLAHFPPDQAIRFAETVILAAREIELGDLDG